MHDLPDLPSLPVTWPAQWGFADSRGSTGDEALKSKLPSITQGLPFAHRSFRDFSELALLGDQDIDELTRDAPDAHIPVLMTAIAGIHYERGDFERAESKRKAALDKTDRNATRELRLCLMLLAAEIRYAKNRPLEGVRWLMDAEKYLFNLGEDPNSQLLVRNTRALRARRSFKQGDNAEARSWIRQYGVSPFDQIAFCDSFIHFTTARALICVNEPEHAFLLLEKLRRQAVRYDRPLDIIEANILASAAHNLCDYTELAREAMAEALLVAQRYGFTTMFTAEARSIHGILSELSQQVAMGRYAGSIDAEFLQRLCMYARDKVGSNQGQKLCDRGPSVKLTERQIMAAEMLAKGYSYSSIADALCIKHSTAKSYMRELYNKLGVFNIDEALDRLYEMRFINE